MECQEPFPRRSIGMALAVLIGLAGCGSGIEIGGAPLFVAPLVIEGTPVGTAIIDTGGAYELMLRDPFGLTIIGEMEVLAFSGRARVGVTESFSFDAGGFSAQADAAIISRTICDCNGLGYLFFRKADIVLALDFARGEARFLFAEPAQGARIRYTAPPAAVAHFDTSFIEVDLESQGQRVSVLALLDTGSNVTVLHRRVFQPALPLLRDRLDVTLTRSELGALSLRAPLFDTPGLPDLIIGTDVMRAWGDEWYFRFDDRGGAVTVVTAGSAVDMAKHTAFNMTISDRNLERVGTTALATE